MTNRQHLHASRSSLRGGRALAIALLWVAVAFAARAQQPEFDHDMTRFPLVGMHERTDCESCHVGGRFVGTPTRCAYCHDGTGKWAITAKPPDHFPTTAACDDCHTPRSWARVRMDHTGASERCESCHNGSYATGRPPDHIPASNQCGECHGTIRWVPATFDHSGVAPGSCFSCHNGTIATGKHPTHVPSSNQCDLCHSTRRWTPATRFDHTGVAPGSCFDCHNGTTATGKHPGHITSPNQCDLCHTTRGWLPATGFDHSGVTPGTCESCHNGTVSTGKPPGHFVTSFSCDACHDTRSFSSQEYMHGSPAYPGDHRRDLDCRECHTSNSAVMSWPAPSYQPDCAGCHANDYRSGPHRKHENPDRNYTVGELSDCSGSCHVYSDSSLTTILERRNGPEHRVSDGDFD